MATSAQNSRRPIAVSSMSSLDSLIDAALDKTTVLSDDQVVQMPVENNVVSSSTLSSIGGVASPTHISSNVSEKEAPVVNDPVASSSSMEPTGMLLSTPSVSSMAGPAAAAPPVARHAPAPAAPNSNTVAEFLFQLSKMLTDDNSEVIEWSNGQINVHDPYKLQDEVLNKYFRHSKFASFQRQLNYFGFRKLAGKGKMAPCSYVNEATTPDIRSLLLIKRKAGGTTTKEKGSSTSKKRSRADSASKSSKAASAPVNPVLAGILHRSSSAPLEQGAKVPPATSARARASRTKVTSSSSQQEVARAAVGKGVRHGFLPSASVPGSATEALASASMIFPDPPHLGFPGIEESLNELANNYRNSLQNNEASLPAYPGSNSTEEAKAQSGEVDPSFQMYNFLSRDSSLVDLAMLVPSTNLESTVAETATAAPVEPTPVNELSASAMPFLDFSTMEQQAPPSEKDESR